MPRGDRTGPAGMGPMTGRAAGYCAGYPVPGYMNPYGNRFAVGARFGYPTWGTSGMIGAPRYAWGAYPAYGGPYWNMGRAFGPGLGRGRGRGRW